MLPACVQQICDPARPATFVPGHARYRRWEFQLQPGESRDDMVMPDRVWQLLSPWLTPNDARLVRSVVYRFHATVASSMRHRSMFLAGDAAHQTPPFLGQGLCAGIRDAANLSWKLDMVASGAAGEGLLDTYDSERRPHSKALVAHAADTGRLIDQLSGRTEGGTTIESAYGGGRPFPNLVDGVLAGTHFMVGHQAPQARVDDQLSDGLLGNGFALLARTAAAIPDDVRTAWQSIGSRVVLMSDAALTKMFVPEDGVMIVRPDRYVAAVASTPDELRELTTALFQRMHVAYR
jgi:3-(3-hydroxy-phenyl)propionate hydroxylase